MADVVLCHIRPSREDDSSNFRITEFLALYRPRSDILVTGDKQQVLRSAPISPNISVSFAPSGSSAISSCPG